ncbi:transcriptional regulator LysR family [Vibrio astriarenae]|nr:transcriptional regulator LysR family [Vibrio sp. C7]
MRTKELNLYKLLAIYLHVVDCRSFTKAADKLGSSRSRVSQSITELEKILNLRLLQRSTRQLALTPEGREVYEQSAQLRRILSRVLEVSELQTLEGRISITCPLDIAINHLRPALNAFEKLWPEIQFDVIASDTRIDIIENEIDLSIRIGPPRDESLVGRLLHQEHMKLFTSPDYLEQMGSISTVSDLVTKRWVLIEQLNSKPIINLSNDNESTQLFVSDFHKCNSP